MGSRHSKIMRLDSETSNNFNKSTRSIGKFYLIHLINFDSYVIDSMSISLLIFHILQNQQEVGEIKIYRLELVQTKNILALIKELKKKALQ